MRTESEVNDQAVGRQTQTCSVTVGVKRSPTDKSVVHVSGELLRGVTETMCRVVATELNRSPELLALDLSGVIRIGMAGDGPASAPADYRAAQRLWLQRSISRLVGCAHSLLAQLAAQRLAQRGPASNVSSSTGLSAKPHLVALVRAGARFEKGNSSNDPTNRDDQQVA
jgi:hypothetical protein